MTDFKKIQDQLEKAMNELKELNHDETQLAYDYIEYANILVKNLSVSGVVVAEAEPCNHEWGKRQTSTRRMSSLGTRTCKKCGEWSGLH